MFMLEVVSQQSPRRSSILKPGTTAADFDLYTTPDQWCH